jgi:hypothetical protein
MEKSTDLQFPAYAKTFSEKNKIFDECKLLQF